MARRNYHGRMYAMCPSTKWTGKLDNNCLVYMLLKARNGRRYKMVVLFVPKYPNLYAIEEWAGIRTNRHHLTTCFFNNSYDIYEGAMGPRTVHEDSVHAMWQTDKDSKEFVHIEMGSLLASFENIRT